MAKTEVEEIFDYFLLRRFFKRETYRYFLGGLDGKERLKKRIIPFQTIGSDGSHLVEKLKDQNIQFDGQAEPMLRRYEVMSQFETVKAGLKILTFRLQIRELFSDEKVHTYEEIFAKAKELGLGFLPHETAADFLLNKPTQPEEGEWIVVFSKPMIDLDGYDCMLSVRREKGELRLHNTWAYPGNRRDPGDEFIFSLSKSGKNIGKEK
jgi:hypothetical protein